MFICSGKQCLVGAKRKKKSFHTFHSLSQQLSSLARRKVLSKVLLFALFFFLIWSFLYHFSSVAGYNYHCYNYLMHAAMVHFSYWFCNKYIQLLVGLLQQIPQVQHDWNETHHLPSYKTLNLFLSQFSEENHHLAVHPSQMHMLTLDSSFYLILCINGPSNPFLKYLIIPSSPFLLPLLF